MIQNACQSCGTPYNETDEYCPKCGEKLEKQQVWPAPPEPAAAALDDTDTALPSEASPLTSSKSKALLAVGLTVVVLAAVWWYFSVQNINKYVSKCNDIARATLTTNQMIVNDVHGNMTDQQAKALASKINRAQQELARLDQDLKALPVPGKYKTDHQSLTEFVRLEDNILQHISLLLADPLDSQYSDRMSKLRDDTAKAQEIASRLSLTTPADLFGNMAAVPDQLSLYCEAYRQLHQEKLAKLAFLESINTIVKAHNNANQDLVSMLTDIRNGSYSWDQYFHLIAEARKARVDLREKANQLQPPPGMEKLKIECSDVLTSFIEYCDLIQAAAKIEHELSVYLASDDYERAAAQHKQFVNLYQRFLNQLQAQQIEVQAS